MAERVCEHKPINATVPMSQFGSAQPLGSCGSLCTYGDDVCETAVARLHIARKEAIISRRWPKDVSSNHLSNDTILIEHVAFHRRCFQHCAKG